MRAPTPSGAISSFELYLTIALPCLQFFSVAVRGGGGPVQVIPYTLTGKVPRGYPTINGHSAAVYDTAWNPFNDNMLATGSDDGTIKLWAIPDGGLTETMREALITLSGHGKPVTLLQWHPTANNVLASAGKDPSVKIWDVEKGVAKVTIDAFGGLVQDLAWSADGTQIITSCKDKLCKVFDARSGAVVSEWTPHEGGKAFKALFLGERGTILTVGFTKQSKREFKLWDAKALAAAGPGAPGVEPLATQEVDQAAGVMLPFYDDDTRMLYLTGKGDGNIRYYEFVDEAPYVYALAEHRTNVSTKGADMLPKRCVAPLKCEVARFLKLTSDSVEPISFIVPRKSEAFQDDIFPDTIAAAPAMSADEWFGGANKPALRVSMDPAKAGAAPHAAAAFKPAPAAAAPAAAAHGGAGSGAAARAAAPEAAHGGAGAAATPAAAHTPAASHASAASSASSAALEAEVAALKKQLAAAQERIAELEAGEVKLKKALAAMTA